MLSYFRPKVKFIPHIRLTGSVAPNFRGPGGFGSPATISYENKRNLIHEAFSMHEKSFGLCVPAVAITINSPGGSGTQATLLHDLIRHLAKQKKVQVLTFAEDLAASAGYMLLCAGDEIYATQSSIIGSIGVISGGVGLGGIAKKLGVEQRVYTAGERKSQNSTLEPESPADVAKVRMTLDGMHADFIQLVESRRAGKLKPEAALAIAAEQDKKMQELIMKKVKKSEEDSSVQQSIKSALSHSENNVVPKKESGKRLLFSGDFWVGQQAKDLGLIDHVGYLDGAVTEKFGEDVVVRNIGRPGGLLGQLTAMENFRSNSTLVEPDVEMKKPLLSGSDLVNAVTSELEWREMLARYGR